MMINMANFLKLAWRNIKRHRRRTIITSSGIIAGVAMMIITNGLLTGMLGQTISNSVELETGHIKIYPEGYYEKSDLMPTNMQISDYGKVIEILNDVDGVEYASPRIKAGGMLQIGQNSAGVVINGIDPKNDLKIRDLKKRIIKGEYLVADDSNLIIGKTLAERLEIGINDEVLVSSVAADGSAVSTTLRVKGIFKTGFPSYDGSMIFTSLLQAQNMLKIERDNATEIVIMVSHPEKVKDVANSIASKLREKGYNYEVLHWERLAPELAQFVEMKKSMTTLFVSIVIVVASLGILNTMLMAVYERIKEIGAMSAFGYKRRNIMSLFLLEGLIIGIIGAVCGCIIGVGVCQYFSVVGIDFGGGPAVVEYMETCIYPRLSVFDVVFPFFFAISVALLASLYPAYKASRLEPVEALRHV